MVKNTSVFSYKKGNSFLHRIPAWCKLLFIPLINILFFCLPPFFSAVLILIQFVIACSLHFSASEQFSDLRAVFYYALLLVFYKLIFYFSGNAAILFDDGKFSLMHLWNEEKDTLFLLVKLFCIMQSASLVFKTSTSLELRSGIECIETFVRKIFHLKKSTDFTDAVSLFLNFIPMVSRIWEQSKRAFIARGGKNSLRMYTVLLPVLFSVGMKKAWNTSRALLVRR